MLSFPALYPIPARIVIYFLIKHMQTSMIKGLMSLTLMCNGFPITVEKELGKERMLSESIPAPKECIAYQM